MNATRFSEERTRLKDTLSMAQDILHKIVKKYHSKDPETAKDALKGITDTHLLLQLLDENPKMDIAQEILNKIPHDVLAREVLEKKKPEMVKFLRTPADVVKALAIPELAPKVSDSQYLSLNGMKSATLPNLTPEQLDKFFRVSFNEGVTNDDIGELAAYVNSKVSYTYWIKEIVTDDPSTNAAEEFTDEINALYKKLVLGGICKPIYLVGTYSVLTDENKNAPETLTYLADSTTVIIEILAKMSSPEREALLKKLADGGFHHTFDLSELEGDQSDSDTQDLAIDILTSPFGLFSEHVEYQTLENLLEKHPKVFTDLIDEPRFMVAVVHQLASSIKLMDTPEVQKALIEFASDQVEHHDDTAALSFLVGLSDKYNKFKDGLLAAVGPTYYALGILDDEGMGSEDQRIELKRVINEDEWEELVDEVRKTQHLDTADRLVILMQKPQWLKQDKNLKAHIKKFDSDALARIYESKGFDAYFKLASNSVEANHLFTPFIDGKIEVDEKQFLKLIMLAAGADYPAVPAATLLGLLDEVPKPVLRYVAAEAPAVSGATVRVLALGLLDDPKFMAEAKKSKFFLHNDLAMRLCRSMSVEQQKTIINDGEVPSTVRNYVIAHLYPVKLLKKEAFEGMKIAPTERKVEFLKMHGENFTVAQIQEILGDKAYLYSRFDREEKAAPIDHDVAKDESLEFLRMLLPLARAS